MKALKLRREREKKFGTNPDLTAYSKIEALPAPKIYRTRK